MKNGTASREKLFIPENNRWGTISNGNPPTKRYTVELNNKLNAIGNPETNKTAKQITNTNNANYSPSLKFLL